MLEKIKVLIKYIFYFLIILISVTLLFIIQKKYSFLLAHTIIEFISIIIACIMFLLILNSRKYLPDNYFIFLGIAYFFVAAFDFIHTLSYKGMNIFTGFDANLPTQLWIISRFIESFSLLIVPIFLSNKTNSKFFFGIIFIFYLSITILSFILVFKRLFPDCFIEGKGLTPFKKNSEYIICFLLLFSIIFHILKYKEFDKKVLILILGSILLTVISEISFTFYFSVYDITNFTGHIFKFISFFLIYMAIIETGIKHPYDSLFRELKQSEEKYRIIVENTDDLVMLTKPDGEIYYLNPSSKKILGYDPHELVNTKTSIAHNKDSKKVKNNLKKALTGESGSNFEYRIIDKYGNLKWINHSWMPIIQENKIKMVVSIIRDITKKKEFDRERENLLFEISEKNKDLEQIIYIVTHDLRTPMTNIQGFTKAIEYSIEKIIKILEGTDLSGDQNISIREILDTEIKEFRRYIHLSIYKIDSLIKGLTEIAQVGREAINIKRINMNKLMTDVIANFKYKLENNNIDIILKELPDCIGDKVQINQVFCNLIDNAIKFMNKNQKGLITVSGKISGECSIYCVEDNGIGINEKYYKDIFEVFKKLGIDDTEGLGLGLAIINRILTRNSGKIWIESEEKKGSKFFISLPA